MVQIERISNAAFGVQWFQLDHTKKTHFLVLHSKSWYQEDTLGINKEKAKHPPLSKSDLLVHFFILFKKPFLLANDILKKRSLKRCST